MAAQANKKRRPVQYQKGDWVLLNTTHFRVKDCPRKLQRRFAGPFQVQEKIGQVAYRIQLPSEWRMHPVFHVSLLRSFTTSQWTEAGPSGRTELPLEDDFYTADEWDTERVLRWRTVKVGKRKIKEYLCTFKDRPVADAMWVRESDVLDLEIFLAEVDRDQPAEDVGNSS